MNYYLLTTELGTVKLDEVELDKIAIVLENAEIPFEYTAYIES